MTYEKTSKPSKKMIDQIEKVLMQDAKNRAKRLAERMALAGKLAKKGEQK